MMKQDCVTVTLGIDAHIKFFILQEGNEGFHYHHVRMFISIEASKLQQAISMMESFDLQTLKVFNLSIVKRLFSHIKRLHSLWKS